MQLQTLVPVEPLSRKIDYSSKIVSLGSCFAVHIAQKLAHYQFQNTVNPWGILFHPLAIEKLVNTAVKARLFTQSDVFCHNEIWSCLHTHSDLNELDAESIVASINQKTTVFKEDLQTASHCIITLGTAWVYRFMETNEIVANCHKVSQQKFQKELLSVADCLQALQAIEQQIRQVNATVQIIYTISPVRHIKDGFAENQRSKAHLIAALHQHIENNDPHNYYFPSYEIMMDELRDYRFYGKDMLHPNDLAVAYIWERFVAHCMYPEALPTMKKVEEVQKGLAHRPFNPYTEAHQQFLDVLAMKLDDLLENYPFMKFR
ncbi:GSCFA domain-containing protein [Paenimyroides aestuarii]|uniref:GSCFA domain-containing protein n=1 Tax=Paenimyroides aestuarii TaxID=2968490 RepID=A0ABY5NTZ1_9FLAO|nr:GSCFA domain-containing protein [Paenimyroides aestuarii]UUV22029.1 GSCFA domain-containing protein [Paenimyroides aestuarii]